MIEELSKLFFKVKTVDVFLKLLTVAFFTPDLLALTELYKILKHVQRLGNLILENLFLRPDPKIY